METAGDAQMLGAALNHSALNLANALGAWLGGLVIAAGLGYRAPSVVGAGLAVGGPGPAGADRRRCAAAPGRPRRPPVAGPRRARSACRPPDRPLQRRCNVAETPPAPELPARNSGLFGASGACPAGLRVGAGLA